MKTFESPVTSTASPQLTRYRIGEFSKYLGVTPDFLKHYEDMGIIASERAENGYRYYNFSAAPTLLECIRLQNLGMTLREIRDLFSPSCTEPDRIIHQHAEVLARDLDRRQAFVDDYNLLQEWKDTLGDKSSEWYVMPMNRLYFLPHAVGTDFIDNDHIYRILKNWMQSIPIVKSALKVTEDGSHYWGFLISESAAKQLHLPINDAVEEIRPGKFLNYQFQGTMLSADQEDFDNPEHPALSLYNSLGLKGADAYYRVIMQPRTWAGKLNNQYGFYMIPTE